MSQSQRPYQRLELPEDLLPRLRARDERAYRQLLETCFAPLSRFAYRIVGSEDVAQDVVQDVLVKVAEMGSAFDPKGSLVAYLYASVRNHALNTIRGNARTSERERKFAEDDAPVQTFNSIEDFLTNLTERQRSAVYLRFVEQRTVPEVAEGLGISVSGTEQLLSRAIKALKEGYK